MRNKKLNDLLEFPNELNVRPFMLHKVLNDMKKRDEESAGDAVPANAAEEDESREINERDKAGVKAAKNDSEDFEK